MRTARRRFSKVQKLLVGLAGCTVLLVIAWGIWRSNSSAVRTRRSTAGARHEKSAQQETKPRPAGQQDEGRDSKEAGASERETAETEGAQTPSETAALPEGGPEPAPQNPTVSKPKGLIIVDSPQNGEVIIGSSFVLSGKADVFENALFYEVEDEQRQQWVAGATHTSGKWGGFYVLISLRDSKHLSTTRGNPRRLSIKIYGDSSQQSEVATVGVTIVP